MRLSRSTRGFTIVELMLAMAGLSMLLLFIALLTTQVSKIYNKGLTLKSADEAGQLIIQDMKRSISQVSKGDIKTDQIGKGRLCIGQTIYAWNYLQLEEGTVFGSKVIGADDKVIGFNGLGSGSLADRIGRVRLVKLNGDTSVACGSDNTIPQYLDQPAISGRNIKHLLNPGNSNLYLSNMHVEASSSPGIDLVSVSFTLRTATMDLEEDGSCVSNSDNGEFCAINRFTFTTRAGSVR